MKKSFWKVIVLTAIFFVILNYAWSLLNADNQNTSNIANYKTNEIDIMSHVWVAMTTNIWTRYKQKSSTPVNVYKDVVDVGYVISNQNIAQDSIITNHMVFLQEYLNIVQTDVKSLLSSTNDRSFALKSFLAQLNFRLKQWQINLNNLNLQKQDLSKHLSEVNWKIEILKNKIGYDFSNFNNDQTLQNIDNFLDLKSQYDSIRTYIIFIDKLAWNYQSLNTYNQKVIKVLDTNQDILIKNAYLVLPNSWSNLLDSLDLIYTESEWNSLNKN